MIPQDGGQVGGSVHRYARAPLVGVNPLGASLSSGADAGNVRIRGYAGGDERAHCAHTVELGTAVRDVLEPRWHTPPAVRPGALASR